MLKKSFFIIKFFAVLTFMASMPKVVNASDNLTVINQLAKGGAPELALSLLGQSQPNAQENISGWVFFEQQRITIMRDWSQWNEIIQRLVTMPENAPPAFKQWAQLQRTNALLQTGRSKEARGELQRMIWQPYDRVNERQLSLYRRLIVRSYLTEDALLDAQNSILKYQQDYGQQSDDWKLLYGRVLIRLGRYAEALSTLDGVKGHEAKALHLMAGLNDNQILPSEALSSIKQVLKKEKKLLDTTQLRYFVVMALAEKIAGNRQSEIAYLEKAFFFKNEFNQNDKLFSVKALDVWDAYEKMGLQKGNEEQLLIGDDESWIIISESLRKPQPLLARAMDIVVATRTADDDIRSLAQENIAKSYQKDITVFHKLMKDQRIINSMVQLTEYPRYKLLEYSLSQGFIKDAANWVSTLNAPPKGVSQVEWDLQRARIAVLGGDANQGRDVLMASMNKENLARENIVDKITQIVFDMQAVEANEEAIDVITMLLKLSTDGKRQRELFFWLADSYSTLDDHIKAAAYYLQSAILLDGKGLDPWGQTARFNAADVLLSGSILSDAERLFRQLLKVTQEKSKKAIIRQKLQEITLKKNH